MTRYAQRTLLQQPSIANWGKAAPAGIGYGVATGGTALLTPPTGYAGVSFTADGTLTVTTAGLFDVLMFGGGGAGAAGVGGGYSGGAAGAGGKILVTGLNLDATTYSLVIGAGASDTTNGATGSPSKFGSLVYALGGGAGGRPGASVQGANGGGGGGGSWGANAGANPLVSGFGFAGGTSATYGGGGGGAGAAGSGITGGQGYDISTFIGGSTEYKGVGGTGSTTTGANGEANSADGGGGGYSADIGGTGGSGIIYVRFKV